MLGIVLAIAISRQFIKEPETVDEIPIQKVEESREILIDLDSGQKKETESEEEEKVDEVTVKPDISGENGTGTEAPLQQSIPPQTDEPEQDLQAEPEKPKQPSDEAIKDPTKTPDGEPVKQQQTQADQGSVPQKEVSAEPEEPQGGETKDGKIYVPGFGWIDDVGNAQGSTAGDMYENGNKIGIMD